jgi:anthranilate phosphoribosyltransferase
MYIPHFTLLDLVWRLSFANALLTACSGGTRGPRRDIVLVNAAAALVGRRESGDFSRSYGAWRGVDRFGGGEEV